MDTNAQGYQDVENMFDGMKSYIRGKERNNEVLVFFQCDVLSEGMNNFKTNGMELKPDRKYTFYLKVSKEIRDITVFVQADGSTLKEERVTRGEGSFTIAGYDGTVLVGVIDPVLNRGDIEGEYGLVVTSKKIDGGVDMDIVGNEGSSTHNSGGNNPDGLNPIGDESFDTENCNFDAIEGVKFSTTKQQVGGNSKKFKSSVMINRSATEVSHKIPKFGTVTYDVSEKGCNSRGAFVLKASNNMGQRCLLSFDMNARKFIVALSGSDQRTIYDMTKIK